MQKPLEEETLCIDEWIAARGDDRSRLVSEFFSSIRDPLDAGLEAVANDSPDRRGCVAISSMLSFLNLLLFVRSKEAHRLPIDLADGPEFSHVDSSFAGFTLVQVRMRHT